MAGKTKKPAGEPIIVEGIVEGEIVSDDFEPTGRGPKLKAPSDASPKASSKAPSKAPWIMSGVLLVFVAGLFAAPWAEQSLRRIVPGLMPAVGAESDVIDDGAAERARLLSVDIAANENAIAALGGRVGTLENIDRSQSTAAPVMPDLAPVEARISAIESRVTALATNSGEVARSAVTAEGVSNTAQNDALVARLEKLEAELAERPVDADSVNVPPAIGSAEGADLAIVTAHLIQRIGSGQHYETELLTIRALVGGMTFERAGQYSAILKSIEDSPSGVATIETLQREFDTLASEVYRAANAPLDAPWWQTLWNNLKNAVTIRPTGDVSGADAGAIIARAEVRIAARDVGAAIGEIESLPIAAQDVLAPWLAAARTRRDADVAAHELLALLEQREEQPTAGRTTGEIK